MRNSPGILWQSDGVGNNDIREVASGDTSETIAIEKSMSGKGNNSICTQFFERLHTSDERFTSVNNIIYNDDIATVDVAYDSEIRGIVRVTLIVTAETRYQNE